MGQELLEVDLLLSPPIALYFVNSLLCLFALVLYSIGFSSFRVLLLQFLSPLLSAAFESQ